MRFSTSRRSSSNWVSPGPRSPTPFLLPREVRPHPLQPRHGVFELGQLDRQPGLGGLARLAKMSRINSVRSSTFRPMAFSRLRVWPGLRSLSKITTSASLAAARLRQFLDFAVAEIGGGVGRLAALGQLADDPHAGRGGQPLQFLQRRPVSLPIRQQDADQDGRLAGHALGAIQFVHVIGSSDLLSNLPPTDDNNSRSAVRPAGRRPRRFSPRSRLRACGCSRETGRGSRRAAGRGKSRPPPRRITSQSWNWRMPGVSTT